MQEFASLSTLLAVAQAGFFVALAIALMYGIHLLFLGVPVAAKLRSFLPTRYSYALLQLDNVYCVRYRQWWCPLWFSHRWVQTVPSHIHARRTWFGKLVRTRRNWRISGFTADFTEAQQQLARLKARHAGTAPRVPSRQMTLA